MLSYIYIIRWSMQKSILLYYCWKEVEEMNYYPRPGQVLIVELLICNLQVKLKEEEIQSISMIWYGIYSPLPHFHRDNQDSTIQLLYCTLLIEDQRNCGMKLNKSVKMNVKRDCQKWRSKQDIRTNYKNCGEEKTEPRKTKISETKSTLSESG